MSTQGPSGISRSELNSAISSLRSELKGDLNGLQNKVSELRGEIQSLRRWTESEIQRLEDEMREIGVMIVSAIDKQTAAVVGEVTLTTAMLERTKQQIESDFRATRGRIDMQTESTLQIEVGKKVADATGLKGKLEAFFQDIRTRYDRSLIGVGLNYELYNQNFQKITEDYQNKLRTIGEHIFRIKLDDIAPAVKAARVPYEDAHSLPIEMDLKRLSARSSNLDETLQLLKTSRLDEVTQSLDELEQSLAGYADNRLTSKRGDDDLCVQGLAISSGNDLTVLSGHIAMQVAGGQPVSLQVADSSFAVFHGPETQQRISLQVNQHTHRIPSPDNLARLRQASEALADKGFISADALALFKDFLSSGKLSILEN